MKDYTIKFEELEYITGGRRFYLDESEKVDKAADELVNNFAEEKTGLNETVKGACNIFNYLFYIDELPEKSPAEPYDPKIDYGKKPCYI